MRRWTNKGSGTQKTTSSLLHTIPVILLLLSTTAAPAIAGPSHTTGSGASLSYTFSFRTPTLTEIQLDNRTFTKIEMDECLASSQPGLPALPVFPAHLLLPPGATVTSIHTPTQGTIDLHLDTPVLPAQELVHPGTDEIPAFVMNTSAYASPTPVSDTIYENQGIGYCRGYTILTLTIHPVRYIPKTGSLSYYPELTLTIDLQQPDATRLGKATTFLRDNTADQAAIRGLVDNPSLLTAYNPTIDAPLGDDPLRTDGLCSASGHYPYVIITSNSLKSTTGYPYNWTSLITHRETHDGLNGTIVTVQDIDACHAYWNTTALYNDSQAHIREFCKDAYQNWETDYILLGGDWDSAPSDQIVPYRLFTDRYLPGDLYQTMACDMYYSHLDGTWWDATDNVWGGSAGSGANNLYAELYIGRIAAYNASMVSNAVQKIIWYDLSASGDWLHQAVFAGGNLGWSATSKQYMEELRLGTDTYRTFTGFQEWNTAHPASTIDFETYYHADLGSNYPEYFSDSIEDDNASIINHLDHSDWNSPFGLTWWSDRINAKPFFGYSQGCLAGRFHEGYAGSEQLQCRFAGRNAFALILNTGYGYGSYYDTDGASQALECYFWDYFFNNQSAHTENWQLGRAQAYSEDKMSTYIDSYSHAWCYAWYSSHLFGDPAQTLRLSDTPQENIHLASESPTNGSTTVPITTTSLSVQITHALGHTFNYTIQTSPNIGSASGTGVHNGTKSCTITGLSYATTYQWTVRVTDGESWVNETYTFTTQNAPINHPPTLTSPSPTNGATGVSISTSSLSITIQDQDGDHFNWTITTAPNIGSSAGTSSTNGTKTCAVSGLAYSTAYTWTVRANDGHQWTNTSYTFTTQSAPVNNPPALSNPSPGNGSTSIPISTTSLSITIGDPEGDPFNWTITTTPNIGSGSGTLAGNESKSCSVSGLAYSTLYTWTARAYDGHHWTNATYTFTTQSAPINNPPTLTNPSPANASTTVPITTTTLSIKIQDPEGDSFNWTMTTTPDIGSSSGTSASNGTKSCSVSGLTYSTTYNWTAKAYDGHHWTNATYTFTTQNAPVNNPPTLTSPTPANGSTTVSVSTASLTILIRDPEADPFNWTMTTTPNIGSSSGTSASNGTKTCPISGLAYSTVYSWTAHAYDGHHWTNATYTFTTQNVTVNSPPVVSSPSPANGSSDLSTQSTTLHITIRDQEGDDFNWTITTIPNIGSSSGTASVNGTKNCTVTHLAFSTTYTWVVRATDGHGWTNKTYHFSTQAQQGGGNPPQGGEPPGNGGATENHPPQTPARPRGTVLLEIGVGSTFTSSVVDQDGDSLRYRFDWGDGTISDWSAWQAPNTTISMEHHWTTNGTYLVRVLAQDEPGENSSWSPTLTVTVTAAAETVSHPEGQIEIPSVIPANKGVVFNASGWTNLTGDALTYTWDFGDGTTGTGMTITHVYAKPGNYTVTLTVTNSSGHRQTKTVAITVTSSTTALAQTSRAPLLSPLPLLLIVVTILLFVAIVIWLVKRYLKPRKT